MSKQDYYAEELLKKQLIAMWKTRKQAIKNKPLYDAVLDSLNEDYITRTWLDGEFNLSLKGDKEALIDIIKVVRRHGFKLGTRPTLNSTTWTSYCTHETIEGATIYIAFTSTYCKRIVEGYETQSVPKYKIVCGEETSPELEAALTGVA